MQPFPNFKHFTTTHHCVTGSLRHIYAFHDYNISEEMMLGLGEGVGFIYWHMKGTLPFIGGRANAGRSGEEGLEKAVARRTGVGAEAFFTSSARKAEAALLADLEAQIPVFLILDMGFLPYFDFGGEEYHFGYHVVVACGYDPETSLVLLADRDEELHPVSLADLAQARGSTYKPFPPRHGSYRFDFSGAHPPQPEEMLAAIRQTADRMLAPPISNLGAKGIRKAAGLISRWPKMLTEKELRDTCINTAFMIDARGGTGGGIFRYMYGRFLDEVAVIIGQEKLAAAGDQMKVIGDRWEEVAHLFGMAYEANKPAEQLEEICTLLPPIADMEEQAWTALRDQLEGVSGSGS